MAFKRKIHTIIAESRLFLVFIQTLIILNLLAVMLESVAHLHENYGRFFYGFEVFSVVIFTVEYLLRLWVADFGTGKPIAARLKFIFSFFGLIDLLAILPFYLPFLISFDLRFLRILRLARLFRVLKIARYSKRFKGQANFRFSVRGLLFFILRYFLPLVYIVILKCSDLISHQECSKNFPYFSLPIMIHADG